MPTADQNRRNFQRFFREYERALDEGFAALFAGAGLSRGVGYVDWKELLREIADDLGLEIDKESDLISIAQYHFNDRRSRDGLSKALIHEFTKDVEVSEIHRLIAELPVKTVWTTNYDALIEDALRQAGKRVDVKRTVANLDQMIPKRDVTIYKMHGDITMPEEAVLTKDDYQVYDTKRGAYSTLLKAALITKTFLFVGFSFSDPNIEYILGRIRALFGENQREHFCIMARPQAPKDDDPDKRAEYEYELRKLDLRVVDLTRYHITALLVDDYSEITEVFRRLARASQVRNVLISGAAAEMQAMERDRFSQLLDGIGNLLAQRGSTLVSGMGLGVGAQILMAFMGKVFQSESDTLDDHVVLMPFPGPSNETLAAAYTKYRNIMVSHAGVVIVVAGNKTDNGKVIESPGVFEEVEIAKGMGKPVIPIGATGYAAATIAGQALAAPSLFLGASMQSNGDLEILNDSASSNVELLAALERILDRLSEASA